MAVPHPEPHGGNAEPQPRSYAGQSAAWAGQGRPSAAGYQAPPQPAINPRNHFEQNIDILGSLPVYDFVDNGDAMNIQASQRGIMAAAQLGPMTVLGSAGGEHQKQTFRVDNQSIPRALPPVLERRGVTPAMFTGDMQKIHEMFNAFCQGYNRDMWMSCVTCCLSDLWTSISSSEGGAEARYRKQQLAFIDDMNRRYRPYGIVWSLSYIPFSGSYMSYET